MSSLKTDTHDCDIQRRVLGLDGTGAHRALRPTGRYHGDQVRRIQVILHLAHSITPGAGRDEPQQRHDRGDDKVLEERIRRCSKLARRYLMSDDDSSEYNLSQWRIFGSNSFEARSSEFFV